MNLLDTFHDNDTLIDCAISIVQEAKKNGFNGFSGFCGQAAILINELLFDNSQTLFGVFNQALAENEHHIGHVACLIDLPDGSYFILDTDAQVKTIEDIQHWGMLDSQDSDYRHLFDRYLLEKSDENFENVSEFTLTQEFIQEHFDTSHMNEQKQVLIQAIDKMLPLFSQKKTSTYKKKF